MSAGFYSRNRRKFFKNLADYFRDQAVVAVIPESAARWGILMDAALWAADDEGDADGFSRFLAKRGDPQ